MLTDILQILGGAMIFFLLEELYRRNKPFVKSVFKSNVKKRRSPKRVMVNDDVFAQYNALQDLNKEKRAAIKKEEARANLHKNEREIIEDF